MLTAVADHFGLGRVLDCTPITEGLMNLNWRLTTTGGVFAVKRLCDVPPASVRRQCAVLPLLAADGVPVPAPVGGEVGGHFYAVAPWMPGVHRRSSELSLPACRAVGDLVARIHIGLRAVLPAPSSLADEPRTLDEARGDLERFRRSAAARRDDFDRLAAADLDRRLRLLDEVGHLRPPGEPVLRPVGWTHGDLNGLNLLFDGEVVSGVLDWDRLAVRAYGLEVVRTATLLFDVGDLGRTAAFAAGYRARFPLSGDALRDAAHRRWWDLVTETWILRLHYDRGDFRCDHILPRSAELRHWWSTHRDEVDASLTGDGRGTAGGWPVD